MTYVSVENSYRPVARGYLFLGQGYLLLEADSPNGRPKKTISQLIYIPQNSIRVPSGFRESNSMIFPWVSMILSCFSMINATQKWWLVVYHFTFLNVDYTSPLLVTPSPQNMKQTTPACADQKNFPWFFHRGILKFHDSMIPWNSWTELGDQVRLVLRTLSD